MYSIINLENVCIVALLLYIIGCSIWPRFFKYLGISIEIVSVLLIVIIVHIEKNRGEIETFKSKVVRLTLIFWDDLLIHEQYEVAAACL